MCQGSSGSQVRDVRANSAETRTARSSQRGQRADCSAELQHKRSMRLGTDALTMPPQRRREFPPASAPSVVGGPGCNHVLPLHHCLSRCSRTWRSKSFVQPRHCAGQAALGLLASAAPAPCREHPGWSRPGEPIAQRLRSAPLTASVSCRTNGMAMFPASFASTRRAIQVDKLSVEQLFQHCAGTRLRLARCFRARK